jgi:sec-independent protein translocase protein TatB
MFDLDVSKMIIVGIVALAVIPPKDLPRVMRTVGQTVGKMRRMASEFQGQFMEAIREVEREADLDSVKKEFKSISDTAKIDTSFDPVGMVRDDVTKAVSASTVSPTANSPEPSGSGVAEFGPVQSEIGRSEISLARPEPEPAATTVAEVREAEPEAQAAPKSAAE